jgi:hypothetical protein
MYQSASSRAARFHHARESDNDPQPILLRHLCGSGFYCDINFSQVTISDERAKVVDFSEPYFDSRRPRWLAARAGR